MSSEKQSWKLKNIFLQLTLYLKIGYLNMYIIWYWFGFIAFIRYKNVYVFDIDHTRV